MSDLSPEAQKTVELVQKLLNLAARNPSAAEAASAAAKAQALLAEHNLEMSAVEEAKREEEKRQDAERKRWRSAGREPTRASDKNLGAWSAGREAGARISLDQQVDSAQAVGRLK